MLPAISFLAAFVLIAAVNWISLTTWRKSVGKHRTERARVLWPIRRSASILTLYIPWILAAATLGYRETTLAGLIPSWLAASAGAVGASWFSPGKSFLTPACDRGCTMSPSAGCCAMAFGWR